MKIDFRIMYLTLSLIFKRQESRSGCLRVINLKQLRISAILANYLKMI